jgi:hypothetical protein
MTAKKKAKTGTSVRNNLTVKSLTVDDIAKAHAKSVMTLDKGIKGLAETTQNGMIAAYNVDDGYNPSNTVGNAETWDKILAMDWDGQQCLLNKIWGASMAILAAKDVKSENSGTYKGRVKDVLNLKKKVTNPGNPESANDGDGDGDNDDDESLHDHLVGLIEKHGIDTISNMIADIAAELE